MQTRLAGLRRIALVYMAVRHAQSLQLKQAAAAVREADILIEQRKTQVTRSNVDGHAALDAGEHVAWRMHESEKRFTEWNAAELALLRQRRELTMLEAAESYRSGSMQLEQIESVLRELREKADAEREHRSQVESDDRFLSQQWWSKRSAAGVDEDECGA